MDNNMQQVVYECTSDDDGNPICNNWSIKQEVIDEALVTYLEACDECTFEMGDIHNEEIEEDNNNLIAEGVILRRNNAEAAERVERMKRELFIMYVKRQNLLMTRFIREIGL